MNKSLVMTLIGPDQTGLVDAVARLVSGHGGNWVESRLARLGGHFAGVVRAEAPADRVEALTAALRGLETSGLHVEVHPSDEPAASDEARQRLTLRLVGHDRAGIVHEVAQALAGRGVNVEAFESEVTSAPMTGEPLFAATAELSAPASADLDALREQLDAVAEALELDLSLDESGVAGRGS